MKKWLIVGIVVILLIGGVGYFISQGGIEIGTPGQGTVTSDTIQIPEGPKIKVVFNGPPELEVNWEKLGMEGFQLQLIGTLTNISQQTVELSEIAFLLDGQQVAFVPGRTLEPGEEMEIVKGFPGYSETTKILEVKIKGFQIIGDSTVSPLEPTMPELDQTVFTKAPKNPQTPAEVTAAFFFLYNEKEYSKAAELLTQESLQEAQLKGGLEYFYEESFHGRQLKKIEFGEVDIENSKAYIFPITFYYTDGYKEQLDITIHLLEKDGKWKINL